MSVTSRGVGAGHKTKKPSWTRLRGRDYLQTQCLPRTRAMLVPAYGYTNPLRPVRDYRSTPEWQSIVTGLAVVTLSLVLNRILTPVSFTVKLATPARSPLSACSTGCAGIFPAAGRSRSPRYRRPRAIMSEAAPPMRSGQLPAEVRDAGGGYSPLVSSLALAALMAPRLSASRMRFSISPQTSGCALR